MPTEDGRLLCCVCGTDLGDAEDMNDPDCPNCLERDAAPREEPPRDLLAGMPDETPGQFNLW